VMKPLLRPYVRAFLRQDRDIMEMQQQGLRYGPVLSLIDDADTQARWYYRLKQEYRRARAEARPFDNPVKPRTLRWRSRALPLPRHLADFFGRRFFDLNFLRRRLGAA